nr:MAG TPA: hypothetical protein [Caudoviricetes sp.]
MLVRRCTDSHSHLRVAFLVPTRQTKTICEKKGDGRE